MAGEGLIHTLRVVATPEGCALSLRPAGPASRARAWMIDFLIRFVAWSLLTALFGYLGALGSGLMLVSGFLLEWLYPVVFEVLWQGRTPGKKMFGLRVLMEDGTPVSWGAAFIRNTLRVVDFFPMFYATGIVAMLLDGEGRRLGDLAAGTLVVHDEAALKARSMTQTQAEEAPPFPLLIEEQRALIEFSRRADRLTMERAEELALTATPLTAGRAGPEAAQRLLRIAAFLIGQRSR